MESKLCFELWVTLQVITIDDRIPCYGNQPIYGRCKDINEMWVPLIEKAYAKVKNFLRIF
jgi:hypothetical protein